MSAVALFSLLFLLVLSVYVGVLLEPKPEAKDSTEPLPAFRVITERPYDYEIDGI